MRVDRRRPIGIVLLRVGGSAVTLVALESVRIASIVPIAPGHRDPSPPDGAVDLAELLGVQAPSQWQRPDGQADRYAIHTTDDMWLTVTTSGRARQAAIDRSHFQRVPAVLHGLRDRIGLVAILVEAGEPWLVLRPRPR